MVFLARVAIWRGLEGRRPLRANNRHSPAWRCLALLLGAGMAMARSNMALGIVLDLVKRIGPFFPILPCRGSERNVERWFYIRKERLKHAARSDNACKRRHLHPQDGKVPPPLSLIAWFTTWFLELEYFLPVVGHAISAICADAHAIFNAESAFRFVVAHEDIYAESHVLL